MPGLPAARRSGVQRPLERPQRENEQSLRGTQGEFEELPTFRFAIEQNKGHVTDGGSARQATIKELPVSKGNGWGLDAPESRRHPRDTGMRSPRAFVIEGRVRTTVIGARRYFGDQCTSTRAMSGTFRAGTATCCKASGRVRPTSY